LLGGFPVPRVRLAVAGLLCAALVSTAAAQDKQKFELKLEKDKTFYQEMTTTVLQIVKVQNQDLTQKQECTFWFSYKTEKVEGDKATIKQKVEGLKMTIDISGNPITYDSTRKEQPGSTGNPTLMDFFKNLEGAEFTVVLNTKTMTVESVSGRDEFIKKLGAGSDQMSTLLKRVLTDDALKQMADPTFALIPDQPRAVKETWQKKIPMNLGPIGSYDVTYDFTYKERVKDDDIIEVKTKLEYKAPTGDTEGQLFKIKSGKLGTDDKEKTPPGEIKYNFKTGRVDEATIRFKLSGELTVTIGGTDTAVNLLQEQTTHIKTSDKSLKPESK
jgi:lipopolysaccharide export system protein LptA